VTTTSDSKTEPEKEKKYLLVYLVGKKTLREETLVLLLENIFDGVA